MSERPATLILGASGGIGSALARQLHAAGQPVYLAGRNTEALAALAAELDSPYRSVEASSLDAVAETVLAAREHFPGLYGVVNCVGSILLKPAHLISEADWHATLNTNLTTAFATVRGVAKAFRSEGASIVLLSSAAASTGLFNHEAVAAAKAGVEGLMRSAAATYAPRGIRVNCVAPGLVETPLSAHLTGNALNRQASEQMHPLGRIGQPEEIARALAFLLDPAQGWITGQVLGVDGGLASLRPRR
ncbi:MAG: SDR family NAD(P)-dependent oxidoreductase [Candidatus Sericytochromatia bacterium]